VASLQDDSVAFETNFLFSCAIAGDVSFAACLHKA
jgi:hypothetical protein